MTAGFRGGGALGGCLEALALTAPPRKTLEDDYMREVEGDIAKLRCDDCGKWLARIEGGFVVIVCPRCKCEIKIELASGQPQAAPS